MIRFPTKAGRRNNLSYYGAGILTAGKARARRISEGICNERATKPAVKRTSPNGSSYFFALPKVALLAAGALFAAGFVVWPGCATPPLPATRTALSNLKRTDFSFGKNAHPSQNDIVTKLGQPDENFADLRVSCYKLNDIKRRKLWLFLGVLPIAITRDGDDLEVAMIQFDDRKQAQRIDIKIIPGYYFPTVRYGDQNAMSRVDQREMRSAAQQWITKPPSAPAGH